MTKRRVFSRAFKVAAVRGAQKKGGSVVQVARRLEIDSNMLWKWKQQLAAEGERAFPGKGRGAGIEEENRRLLAENARLRVERDILKKSAELGARSTPEKFRFIEANRQTWPAGAQCAALGVSRSGYFRWRTRKPSKSARRREELTARIRKVHRASRRRYGAPRIHAELLAQGVKCDRKTVARLMRVVGMSATPARPFRLCTTDTRHDFAVAGNLLDRNFDPAGPNLAWGADITYVPTGEGWLYLAVVEDFYSRRIVGWATSARLDGGLAVRALGRAVGGRGWGEIKVEGERMKDEKDGGVHRTFSIERGTSQEEYKTPSANQRIQVHSDRGVQYAGVEYQRMLAAHGLVGSMSRRGNCWDNAPVESFFATLKKELIYRREFGTRRAARASLGQYIETFYNRERRHSGLGFLSPCEFEGAGT